MRWMWGILFPLCCLLPAESLWAASTCSKITVPEFRTALQEWKKKSPKTKLAGIASWCSSCKENLTAAAKDADGTIFLVAFDEPKSVDKVLKSFGVSSRCYYGDDVVAALKIDELPWKRSVEEILVP